MIDLKGKTLFITGASRGIGLAIAQRADEGKQDRRATVPHPRVAIPLKVVAGAIAQPPQLGAERIDRRRQPITATDDDEIGLCRIVGGGRIGGQSGQDINSMGRARRGGALSNETMPG